MTLGREMQCDLQTAIQAEREWKMDAKEGRSCSARSPVVNTPSPMPLPYHAVQTTPEPVVNPMKKAVLQANARLHAQVKERERVAKGAERHQVQVEQPEQKGQKRRMEVRPEVVSNGCVKGTETKAPERMSAVPVDPEHQGGLAGKAELERQVVGLFALEDKKPEPVDGTEGHKKKKRRPFNGPMYAPQTSYMQARRREGIAYREAQKMWVKSEERAAVVASLSASERSKRRF